MKRALIPSTLAAGALLVSVLPGMVAQAAVAGPVNLTPDDTATWQTNTVLAWDAVSGASGYEVAVTNDGFGTDGPVLTSTTATNRYVLPVSVPRGDYQWRVRAVVSGGKSDWSATADLLRGWDPAVAPALSQTDPGNAYDWGVTWAPIPDASFYEVQYSPQQSEPENASPPPYEKQDVITCFTTHTTFVPSLLTKGTERAVAEGASCEGTIDATEDYSVRVRGRDGSVDTRAHPFAVPANSCTGAWQAEIGEGWAAGVPECTGWSNEVTGLLLPPPNVEPGQPASLAAADPTGACSSADPCTDAPVMTWSPTPDAVFYRVYLSRDRSGTDYDRLYTNIFSTTFQISDTLPDRSLNWYWRVQACGADLTAVDADGEFEGACGPVSDAASFTVANTALKLAGAAPVAGDPTVKKTEVDFTIPTTINQADHQAQAFRIQVAKDAAFTNIAHQATFDHQAGSATETTYRWDGADDGTYHWRYRAVDQTGALSPWTYNGTLTFTVDAGVPKLAIKTGSGFGLGDKVVITSDKALSGVNSNTLGVMVKNGTKVDGTVKEIDSKTWEFTPAGKWVANAPYLAWAAAGVTAGNGQSPVSDGVVRRPSGLIDSKTSSLKKVDGDFPWKTLSASDAVGKSYVAAKHKKASAKVPSVSAKFGGTKVSLVACKSDTSGFADIYLDGAKVKSVNLYKDSSRCGEVWSKTGLTDGVHTLEVKVSGKKDAASGGTYVAVDAVKAG